MPGAPTKLFMFDSDSNKELHAFTDVSTAKKLPEKHGPWTGAGVLRADQDPPHGLPRTAIENGVAANGFQLWRSKKAAPAAGPAAAPAQRPATGTDSPPAGAPRRASPRSRTTRAR